MASRKNWAWTGIDRNATSDDLRAKYRTFRRGGLHGVFLGGGVDEREFEIVAEAGLELHSWMWTTNRGDAWIRENHPEWYMVSRSGKSCADNPPYVDYYRWVSPVIPEVRAYISDRAEELAAHTLVAGVHLDYVRYPDVILPRGLWANYGLDQTEELPDYDFCYGEATCEAFRAASGRDPREIADPANDQEWLRFRYETVTSLVRELVGVVHHHEKLVTAAVFPTPALARMICRQDWDKWPLDAVCPMLYHGFYEKPVEWIGEAMRENIQAVNFPIYAGIFMPDLRDPAEFSAALSSAFKRGAAGVSLFTADHMQAPEWEVFQRAVENDLQRQL